jgi:hypothetical protein
MVADPTALEGARPRPRIKGWEGIGEDPAEVGDGGGGEGVAVGVDPMTPSTSSASMAMRWSSSGKAVRHRLNRVATVRPTPPCTGSWSFGCAGISQPATTWPDAPRGLVEAGDHPLFERYVAREVFAALQAPTALAATAWPSTGASRQRPRVGNLSHPPAKTLPQPRSSRSLARRLAGRPRLRRDPPLAGEGRLSRQRANQPAAPRGAEAGAARLARRPDRSDPDPLGRSPPRPGGQASIGC